MKHISVFNSVLGPVMRGPSSSHTAASFHIGRMARDILGEDVKRARIAFDERGSYGVCHVTQGSDRAFAVGLMGWNLASDVFHDALNLASAGGAAIEFVVGHYEEADHPNWVRLSLMGANGREVAIEARSTGGGSVEITEIGGFPVSLAGDTWTMLIECDESTVSEYAEIMHRFGAVSTASWRGRVLLSQNTAEQPSGDALAALARARPRVVAPLFFPVKGRPLWGSAVEAAAHAGGETLGEAALAYECELLGISRSEAMEEMWRRYMIMKTSCGRALSGEFTSPMQLLSPTAGAIFAKGRGNAPYYGMHTRAAARAMAIMHANGAMEVVVAAPTGGSAGALPGAVITLDEDLGLPRERICLALFAAGGIGVIFDNRATFAAEVAGCQVEIGAGGAMAAAACVEAAGGTARKALDAAAISLQNTMGLVCDPVQGVVEIPCHTRNAIAAASAFVNADLVLGGYENPVPLDETIDASFAVGKSLSPDLRCTALGGLAACPSALAMTRLR